MRKSLPNARRVWVLLSVPTVLTMVIIAAVNSSPDRRASAAPPEPSESLHAEVHFNHEGELERPTGYRKWTYVGTPLTPNDLNNENAAFPEFHTVYMNPDAYNHYEKTGEFLDGTVLVKELISVGAQEASSGKGYFMGDFIGLEVAIKHATRFKEEPGNWAYFSFGHKYPLKDKAKMQPAASCNDCHSGNAEDDWVFTQYYPVLRAATGSGSQ